jgi:hypothetical protein
MVTTLVIPGHDRQGTAQELQRDRLLAGQSKPLYMSGAFIVAHASRSIRALRLAV